ncbi:threonyl-trna synthetase [Methylobacterium fujisawaense]|uniref:threonyl-trna synthetase n=1 Tax=Methylobacterium fujisawaense TaxID=107400 RepID=UPI0031F4CC82
MRALAAGMAALSVLALTRAAPGGDAAAGEAPFGLAWGPVQTAPKPALVDREANLTALHYPRGHGPAVGAGTAEVVLVVCREEGLQEVVWIGLPLSGEALARARRAIHDEGVRRYGEPDAGGTPDSETWPGGRALLASRRAADGGRALVMTAFGPGFGTCSGTHRAETGHPAGAHVADLIDAGDP